MQIGKGYFTVIYTDELNYAGFVFTGVFYC